MTQYSVAYGTPQLVLNARRCGTAQCSLWYTAVVAEQQEVPYSTV